MRKPCSNCNVAKDLVEGFGRDKSRHDGYTHDCKECRNAKSKLWTRQNPVAARKAKAGWQSVNIDKKRAADKAYKDRKREELDDNIDNGV